MKRFWVLGLILAANGCSQDEPAPPPAKAPALDPAGEPLLAPDAGVVEHAQVVDAPALGETKPPTLEQLRPQIRWTQKHPLARPKGFEVHFAEPVFNGRGQIDQDQITIEPALKGRFSRRDALTLEYLFSEPVSVDAVYTVRVKALQKTRWKTIKAAGAPITASLKSPQFLFYDSTVMRSPRFQLILSASAPIMRQTLLDRLEITADGVPISIDASRPRVVAFMNDEEQAVIQLSPVYKLANVIAVDVKPGVSARDSDAVAPGFAQVHNRHNGKRTITIKGVHATASADGFGVDIICHDIGRARWFYHRDMRRGFRVGHRCLPSQDSASLISVSPPVDFRVVPGRGGFRLLGDFRRGSYRVKLHAGLVTVDEGFLQSDHVSIVRVGARPQHLEFVESGRYLPKAGWKTLRFRHRNVGEVQLEVRQIRPENLRYWLSSGSERADQRISDVVVKKSLRVGAEADVMATGSLNVEELIGADFRGVLQVQLKAPGASSSTRLMVSDINLLAKRSLQTPAQDKRPAQWKYTVWSTAMHTHQALAGTQLELVAPSGRAIATCITGADGSCALEDTRADAMDPARGIAVVARRGGDLTYLRFKDLELPLNQSQIGGERYRDTKPYRTFVYGDRDLYRPDETAHVVAMVRTSQDKPPEAGLPVEFLIHDPRRRKVAKKLIKTDDSGLASVPVKLSPIAPTGRYTVSVRIGDKEVGRSTFRVEEFMPERMRADVALEQPVFSAGEPVEAAISAEYLFGGSAKGSPVVVECQFSAGTPKPKGYDGYSFVPWKAADAKSSGASSGRPTPLNQEGKTAHRCELQGAQADRPLRVNVEASVQEAGSGRTTRARSSALILPGSIQLGVASAQEKLSKGQTASFKAVVLDKAGQPTPLTDPIEFTLYRIEEQYAWGYDEDEGRWTYDHRTRLVEEGRQEQPAGQTDYTQTFEIAQNAPRFLIRAQSGVTRSEYELRGTGSRYWWRRNQRSADRTPAPDRPVQLVVEGPKQARVGEPFSVRFEAPYAGRALVSIETDVFRRSSWHAVTPGPQSIPLTVTAYQPNVYVSVLILKDPHLESQQAFVPGRAFGLTSVAIDPVERRQEIAVTLPDEIRPNSDLLIKLDLGPGEPGRRVTIAAIDEGILSLTGYKTPDPISALYAKRRLEVSTFETVGWNLMLPAGAVAQQGGGDEMSGGAKRVQPTKPVALWSGILEVPISGALEHTFKIPTYRGSLKVMVVSAGPQRVGSAAQSVPVRDPLVLLASLPKQLSQGDRFFIPVSLTNLSGRAQAVDVKVAAEAIDMGGDAPTSDASLRFIDGDQKTLQLADGQGGVVRFEATALRALGAAKLSVTARAGALVSQQSLDVPFSPQAPRTRLTRRVELKDGENDLAQHLTGWLPTTERSSIWVTTNPYGETFKHLSHLIRYPYGCMEQTVSSARPLLFAGLALSAVDPESTKAAQVPDMIRAGIERVLSMQTPSGGFAYWPGGSRPTEWATAYGVHFLMDAKQAGHEVPEFALSEAISWLGGYTNGSERYGWQRNAKAYAHYVLARAGEGRKGQAKALLERTKAKRGYDLEARMLLKAALYLSGDRTYEAELKKPDLSQITTNRRNSWSFYSDLRRRAMTLAVISSIFPREPGGEALAELVAGALKRKSRWYNTQELAWALTGLGMRLGSPGDLGTVELLENKKALKATTTNKLGVSWDVWRASERKDLKVRLTGGKGARYAIIQSDGIRTDAQWDTGNKGLRVNRQLFRQNGQPFDPAKTKLELGEMVRVELEIQNLSPTEQENLALVDRLPAGFEIEAASSIRGFRQRGQRQWNIAHRNTRDDRIELFGRLNRGQKATFNYNVRAVSAGQFRQPPVEAEAMYNPELRSLKLGTQVTIEGPWQQGVD
ncbi:MAG: MG2 domain-containing protein [Myxococcota bacterium]|nr:MG2 domain-containing protein [Myxococcota bacterium]